MLVKRITIALTLFGALLISYGVYRFNAHRPIGEGDSTLLGDRGTGSTESVAQDAEERRYVNSEYGFSFLYPKTFSVGQFRDGEAETILVQSRERGSAGFQIYVVPLSQPVVLTPDFIESDLPGVVVASAQKILLDGVEGIMFESNHPSFGGKSFEIWFARADYLYQVTSYMKDALFMRDIIGTWTFKKS